ncbi:hypothetical protein CR513_18982, partial [Mucuna pruriens]
METKNLSFRQNRRTAGSKSRERNSPRIKHYAHHTNPKGIASRVMSSRGQIAPTLEEYERIIGGPRVDGPPYLYQGNWSSLEKIVRLLKILTRRQQRSGVEGIPLSYLEEKMCMLAEIGDWDTLADTLGLAAIIILPHLND